MVGFGIRAPRSVLLKSDLDVPGEFPGLQEGK